LNENRDRARGHNEHGDNLLNPNISKPKEKCPDCQAIFMALADMKAIDKEDNIEPVLLDELHCGNGHRIPEEEIRKVLAQ